MSLINREALMKELGIAMDCSVCEHNVAPRCIWKPNVVDICEAITDAPTIEPEPHWIPVSERLPDGQGFYLVSVGAPYKTVRVYEYKPCEWYENENLWKKEDGSYCLNWFVEAWMPLPEPYREEGD